MQTSSENKRLTILISLLIVTIIVSIPMIAFGVNAPTGDPSIYSAVNATFNSVTYGTASASNPAVTSPFGKFVGLSASKLSANQGGYAGAKAACPTATFGTGAHVCTAKEITNSYEFTGTGTTVPDPASTELLWINNGPPGYIMNNANDCSGWSTTIAGAYGSVWLPNSTKKYAMITSCNKTHYFACCTY